MSENLKDPRLLFGLAIITSIVTGVGCFIEDLGYWRYAVGYTYASGHQGPLIAFGVMFVIFTILAFLALGYVDIKIPEKMYLLAAILCLVAFVYFLASGITFAAISEYNDVWWWFGFPFYAGIIGSPLTGVFFYFGYKNIDY